MGWFKLNVDGSMLGKSLMAYGRGLVRDTAHGCWVHGFVACLKRCSVLMAEFWAISEGIKLAEKLKRLRRYVLKVIIL